MTNSERRVGLVRKLLDPPGEARPDWQIYAGLAARARLRRRVRVVVARRGLRRVGGADRRAAVRRHRRLARAPAPRGLGPVAGAGAGGRARRHRAPVRATRASPTPDGRARFAPTPHADPADAPSTRLPARPHDRPPRRPVAHDVPHGQVGGAARRRRARRRQRCTPTTRPGIARRRPRARRARGAARSLARGRASTRRCRAASRSRRSTSARCTRPPARARSTRVSHASVDPTSKQPELKAIAVAVEPAGHDRTRSRQSRAPAGAGSSSSGTGMAGLARRRGGRSGATRSWRITMLGEEPGPVYNRILLSQAAAGECGPGELELKPLAWYAARGVDLRGGCPAASIDTAARPSPTSAATSTPYDALVLATGSRAVRPAGRRAPTCRTSRSSARAPTSTRSTGAPVAGRARRVVLGGGLLGLEAAAGLRARGARVTVVEPAPRLMGRQLDDGAARMLERALAARGIAVRTGVLPAAIDGRTPSRSPTARELARRPRRDRRRRAARDRARARRPGCRSSAGSSSTTRMRAGAPDVFAVGECAEHRGTVYGLWAPLAEQARVAGAAIAGDPAAFQPADDGDRRSRSPGSTSTRAVAPRRRTATTRSSLRDTRRGLYRKLVLDGDRLVGRDRCSATSPTRGAARRRCARATRPRAPLLATAPGAPRRRRRPTRDATRLLVQRGDGGRDRPGDRRRRPDHRRAGRQRHARVDRLRRLRGRRRARCSTSTVHRLETRTTTTRNRRPPPWRA